MTRMDYFTVGSTILVFLALIVVVLTSFLEPEICSFLSRKYVVTVVHGG
jgi:hypothetical protein